MALENCQLENVSGCQAVRRLPGCQLRCTHTRINTHEVPPLAYLVAAQRHFATAAGTAAYVAVVANVANAIGKLGLKAYVTGGIQFDAGLLLLLGALPDLHLQCDNFVLFSAVWKCIGIRLS